MSDSHLAFGAYSGRSFDPEDARLPIAVIILRDGIEVARHAAPMNGLSTPNQAALAAVVAALRLAQREGITRLRIQIHCKPVVQAIEGRLDGIDGRKPTSIPDGAALIRTYFRLRDKHFLEAEVVQCERDSNYAIRVLEDARREAQRRKPSD